MHYVIGIDVSKATSQVAVAIDGKVTQHFKITHDALEFNQLNTIIMQFNKFPDIVFEATGIYSRRLKSFLDGHNYPYTYLNPLAVLRSQENGNNIHELAFSIRGDWLVKNNLYDPEIRMIDQNKLKHAEQEVAKTLINKGFNLPLGEDENDVVWFGVIHQDTDHLNMHLWFTKKSQETRPEMIKQEGKYKGQPIGVIPLEVIEQAKRQFRKQLMSSQELRRHQEILKGVGGLKKEIVEAAPDNLLNDRHAKAIKQIYDALPQDMKGRWQVGNAHLTAGKGKKGGLVNAWKALGTQYNLFGSSAALNVVTPPVKPTPPTKETVKASYKLSELYTTPEPHKSETDDSGKDNNGQNVKPGQTLKYKLTWDLKGLEAIDVDKDTLAKGLSFMDDYDETKLDITDQTKKDFTVIDAKTQKSVMDELQQDWDIKNGKWTLKAKNVQDLLTNHAGHELTITFNPMVKKDATGTVTNTAVQNDFGQDFDTETVKNPITPDTPKPDTPSTPNTSYGEAPKGWLYGAIAAIALAGAAFGFRKPIKKWFHK